VPFDKAVVIDWETSGVRDDAVPVLSYLEGPQGIEIGAVVIDLSSWNTLGEFGSRVRFMGSHGGLSYGGAAWERLSWSAQAEKIHGITLRELTEAPKPVEVAERFVQFIYSHLDPNRPILLCGHNPDFDAYFTRQLLFMAGRLPDIRFAHRRIDTFTVGFLTMGCEDSDELFLLTQGAIRSFHNALDDARLTVSAMKSIVERLKVAGFGTPKSIKLPKQSESC